MPLDSPRSTGPVGAGIRRRAPANDKEDARHEAQHAEQRREEGGAQHDAGRDLHADRDVPVLNGLLHSGGRPLRPGPSARQRPVARPIWIPPVVHVDTSN